MFIFDYLYYKIYWFYKNLLKEKDADFVSACILAVIQGASLLLVLETIYDITKIEIELIENKFYIPIMIFFIGFNYLRYRNKIEVMVDKWSNEPDRIRKRKSRIVLIYIILLFGFTGDALTFLNLI